MKIVIPEPQNTPEALDAQQRLRRGVAYQKQGQMSKAIADYTDLINSPDVPGDIKAKALIARCHAYADMGKERKSLNDVKAFATEFVTDADQD